MPSRIDYTEVEVQGIDFKVAYIFNKGAAATQYEPPETDEVEILDVYLNINIPFNGTREQSFYSFFEELCPTVLKDIENTILDSYYD